MASRLFEAKFSGQCTGCTLPIKKGESIGYYGNNTKPTCADCWAEGMPELPDPRGKHDVGIPQHIQEVLAKRAETK